MSEPDDEYLWSGQGTASEDVSTLERSLAPLRWRPQVLVLPGAGTQPATESKIVDHAPAHWWPALAAGLVAAAAVLALLLWPKPDAAAGDPAPTVNPTAPPTSPLSGDSADSRDSNDPFGPRAPAGNTGPIADPDPDPDPAPSVSPDLVDPFAGRNDPRARPQPRASDDLSPDLKNPFEHSPPSSDHTEDLRDPFADRPDSPTPTSSPDLEDPFSR